MQGDILIHDGDTVPCEASFPGALGHPGHQAQAIPIGLYLREEGPDGESYRRMGNYKFFATIGEDGFCRFLPTLRAEQDKTISLLVTDLLSNDSVPVERLSILGGQPIPKPAPILADSDTPASHGQSIPKVVDKTIDEKRVSQERRAALALLHFAQNIQKQHPLLKADGGLRRKLEEKATALEKAVKSLPVSGPVDQKIYQLVANRTTELTGFLEVNKLLSEEERSL
jgi:hypothetical protein